jgi:hypothetical protein
VQNTINTLSNIFAYPRRMRTLQQLITCRTFLFAVGFKGLLEMRRRRTKEGCDKSALSTGSPFEVARREAEDANLPNLDPRQLAVGQ